MTIVGRLPIELISNLSFFQRHRWEVWRGIGISFLRSFQAINRAPWFLNLTPPTGVCIRDSCSQQGWTHGSHVLSNASGPDAVIHEIVLNEAATAAPVVVYFHGGGYHNALVKQAHVPGAYEIGTQLRASSVFLLEYTLTPGAKYPTQLQQAVLAWNYLLNEREIVPARILLGGDSAGGHLALTLLAHGMQPCPGVTPMAQLGPDENRLKGLLLISPWPNMRTNVPSFRMFEHIDMINIEGVHDFIDLYGPRLGEVWAEPLAADRSFWANLPVENLLVTCGNAECLRDSIVELFDGLKAAEENGARCDLILAEGEIHVHSALDHVLGIGPCESRRGIIDWVRRLS